MTDPRTCARCGSPLTAAGECPRCLLRLGLDLPPRDPAGSSASEQPAPPPAPRPPPPSLDDIARRFPQLEIKSLLGQGGMGVVYRARQPRLDREVALKVLPPELSSQPHFAERFLREARAMARLAHPNIVAVHDFGETDGMCWLMMELVDGVNLRQALKSGALPPEKALAVVPQMCDALQYAHDEGVVHRDIKPENVLLDRAGRVKIADFGLAKLVGAQDISITRETQVFGTPHYMAPEQMEGARDVDHRADIFSLGVVFYEMLTGRLPVGRFDPPSRRVHVDVRLDEVVLHALEHEPERRYQHVSEVKTDIESVAAGHEPAAAQADAGKARKHGPPHGFVGVWLEWPKKKRPGEAGASAEPSVHRIRWGGRPGWRMLALFAACVLAWHIAGAVALEGGAGPFVALALMLGMAITVLVTAVQAVPALRDALVAEAPRFRALRFGLATFAVLLGLLATGFAVLEGWEHGTRHYVSDARDPVAWGERFSREDVAEDQQTPDELILGPPHLSTTEAWMLGTTMLLLFGAAGALRARGEPGWHACVGPMLAVPVVLLGSLGLLAAATELKNPVAGWPELAPVRGSVALDIGWVETGVALRTMLARDGYAMLADVEPTKRIDETDSQGHVMTRWAPMFEEHMAFEPLAPWDRWSLERGMPRRRRPHVALLIRRAADDEHHCVVEWDCGWVRPVAGEAAAWKEWIERILRDAPRFTGSAAGG